MLAPIDDQIALTVGATREKAHLHDDLRIIASDVVHVLITLKSRVLNMVFAIISYAVNDDQWLVGINEDGRLFPFAFNALNDEKFTGATFSPDGRTLFVNIQGPPGLTFAIWGPWRSS